MSDAERLVGVVISGWKAEIEDARTGTRQATREVLETAQGWKEHLDSIKDPDERWEVETILHDVAVEMDAGRPGDGARAYGLATGRLKETGSYVAEWLLTLSNEPKTLDMKRTDLRRFVKRFPLTKDLSERSLQRWADELQQQESLKPSTIRRIISACRGYWSYLHRRGVVELHPDVFRGLVQKRPKNSKAHHADRRRPFPTEDIVRLLAESLAEGDRQVALLIAIGMYTGCRIEEICALRVEDVTQDKLSIVDAKTEAGIRDVPVHPELSDLLKASCADSHDGYVIPGLTTNKYGDRSNAVGKRFGRLKKRLGYGPSQVFHSIRKTVATQLDAEQVPEAISARILGHDIPTMTYGLYSGGAPLNVLSDALAKVSYPLNATCIDFLAHQRLATGEDHSQRASAA
ncbi:tyrosine-type recombinase/integrase [Roseivivax sp. GX 12232]|nr:tyrosine-type recombinase/integrase [Roseivivax sp. GX 12232]MCE0504133.1 tyrosine-type recombinase/integrase [Roseivivax sp. GX 12232]